MAKKLGWSLTNIGPYQATLSNEVLTTDLMCCIICLILTNEEVNTLFAINIYMEEMILISLGGVGLQDAWQYMDNLLL